ncbi:MAG: DUF11 domain-containing protein, partial [Candidatus Altiarchaeum hamiconexum]|nr:DUF11 domain-containing protein [Candidatus Altarchaeum hamiconexum]
NISYHYGDGVENKTNSSLTNTNVSISVGKPDMNLIVNKSVNDTNIFVNEEVTFIINITNIGTGKAVNITLNDVLPAFLVNTSYINSTCPDLEQGNSCLFNFTAKATSEGNASNKIDVNYKDISGAPKYVSNYSPVVVATVPGPVNLTVSKELLTTGQIFTGDKVSFRINITNIGDGKAVNITLNDVLPAFLVNTSYINSTCPDLEQGNSCLFNFTAKATSEGNASNKIDVNYKDISGAPKYVSNYSPVVVATVPGPVNLTVSKELLTTGQIFTGDKVSFRINITNIGDETAYNITIEDVLTCKGFNGIVKIHGGNLSTNQSYIINFTLSNVQQGNCTNRVTVTARNSANEPWAFATNVSFEVKVPIIAPVPITVEKNIETTATYQGIPMVYQSDIVNFTINITNKGNETITRLVINDAKPSQSENLTQLSQTIDNLNFAPNESFIWNITLKINQNASIGDAGNTVAVTPYANMTQGTGVSSDVLFRINAKRIDNETCTANYECQNNNCMNDGKCHPSSWECVNANAEY